MAPSAGQQRPGAGADPQQPLGLGPRGQPLRPQPPGQRREETLGPQERVSRLKTGRSQSRNPAPSTPLPPIILPPYSPMGFVPQVHHGGAPADGEGLCPRPAGVHRGQFPTSGCRRIPGGHVITQVEFSALFKLKCFSRRTCGR